MGGGVNPHRLCFHFIGMLDPVAQLDQSNSLLSCGS